MDVWFINKKAAMNQTEYLVLEATRNPFTGKTFTGEHATRPPRLAEAANSYIHMYITTCPAPGKNSINPCFMLSDPKKFNSKKILSKNITTVSIYKQYTTHTTPKALL